MNRSEARDFLGSALAIAIEPTYFDLERCWLEPKEVAAMAVRCHANALRVGMKSHQGHAYYQSAIAPHAPGLGDRDLLKEFQESCREAGITLVVYMDSKWDIQRYVEHPDWAIRFGGQVRAHEAEAELKFYPMCPNSPYLDYFESLLREVVGNYAPEVLYIDNFGVVMECECVFCAEAFREVSRQTKPSAADWHDPLWQKLRHWSRERNFVLARRLVDTIRSARPETLVVFNRGHFRSMTGHGNPEDIHEFAHHIADNVHGESAVRFYGQSFAHINEQCAFGRAIDTPMWTWVEYPLLPWSHVAAPKAEIMIKAAKVLANGGRPMVWNVPRAPNCDERGLEGLAEVFGLATRFPDYFNHTEHLPFLAVLHSSQTMEDYCRGVSAQFEECQKEFSGALALARHSHVPADILLDNHITREHLSQYRVLVLPNTAALSDEQCEQIRAYVGAGGGLIATFETSLYNEGGQRRRDFGLAEVFGASYRERLGLQSEGYSTGYSVVEHCHPITVSVEGGSRLPAGGHYLGVAVGDGSVHLSTLLTRCRYYCDHPGQPTEFPGLIGNEYGQGRVLYVPGQFSLIYAERGFPDYRRLFRDAVEWMTHGELPLRTTLPDTVEVTVARTQAGDFVVHLVNCSADLTRPVETVIPVTGATISLRLPSDARRRVQALRAEAELPTRQEGKYLSVALPELREYEVVVVGN